MTLNLRPTAICSAAILCIVLTGCASSGGSSSDAPPGALASNPFAAPGATSFDQVKVKTLRVFGDSYSALDYTDTRGTINWATEFGKRGRAERVDNYAIGGARASSGSFNSFDRQINTALSSNNPIGSGDALDADLTVIYLGYNDIGRRGSSDGLRSARASYFDGINKLIKAGATNGNSRIFVTQIHDWSRNPRNEASVQGQVLQWNDFVATQANANPSIVAVDLFTVFERIYTNPARFGFVNVSTVDFARSPIDALYYDSQHFGNRGQDVISRTFEHYITRGWEWASTINAGAEAALRLNQDIDNKVLLFSHNNRQQPRSGFAFHAMGNLEQEAYKPARYNLFPVSAHPGRLDLSGNLNPTSLNTRGFALSFRPEQGTGQNLGSLGVAINTSHTPRYFNERHSSLSQKSDFNATTLYWHKALGGFDFTTQASFLRTKFDSYKYDDLLDLRVANAGAGSTWSFEQRLRHSSRLGNTTVSPWISVTQLTHTLDAQTAQSLYTTDVRYAATRSSEWLSGVGLDLQSDPIELGHRRSMTLGASISHLYSLKRDSVGVSMQETGGFGAFGAVQREVFNRPSINRTQLGFNAAVALSPRLNVQAFYATDTGDLKQGQRVSLQANMKF
jgi:lysophospholipase L1-like esterase